MKKAVWMALFLVVALPFYLCASQEQVTPETELSPALDNGDVFPVASPLIEQIFDARAQGDFVLHEALIEEWKQILPGQPNNLPEVNVEKVDAPASPAMRWGNDIVLWNGDVYYNAWAILVGVDDEAISVDCHVGDTLLAAVTNPDSSMAVLRSDDMGMTWSHIYNLTVGGYQLLEPEVIYGPDGDFHIFMRCSYNNGTLIVFNFAAGGGWTAPWIVTSADTLANYTVCTDRTDWTYEYFYLAYHRVMGGEDLDEIDFTRSFDLGETWEAPTTIQVIGSGSPDLAWGNDPYLYLTRLFWNSNNKRVYTRRSSDGGNSWLGSIQVCTDGDTVNFMGPQIACSHDGTQDAWVLFPKQDPGTANEDYGMGWTWSQDMGATWSSWAWANSYVDYNEVLPSISVHDGYHDSLYEPYVTFIRSYYDWTDPVVYLEYWDSGSWSATETYNDNVPELTRPIQTWEAPGVPAMAYVGSGGVNVYYDAWSVAVEEENPVAQETSFGKAHPNPFSARTLIELTLPKTSAVSVKAYNVLGQEVSTIFNGTKDAGTHSIEWKGTDNNGNRLPSGIYFMRIKTPYRTSSKKLILQ